VLVAKLGHNIMELTHRQLEILKAIISEYIENADEVSSHLIVDKYNLGVSSATIRNEMMRLMELGHLVKSHISSGRLPTDQALRLYVKQLGLDKALDAQEEAVLKQEVFRDRFEREKLIRSILDILAKYSKSVSFVLTEGGVRYYGVSSLMRYEEMKQVNVMQRIFDILEDEKLLRSLFERYQSEEIGMLIGEETGLDDLSDCAIVFGRMPFWDREVIYYGVIGSKRLDYARSLSTMRLVRNAVEQSLRGWR